MYFQYLNVIVLDLNPQVETHRDSILDPICIYPHPKLDFIPTLSRIGDYKYSDNQISICKLNIS